MIHHSTAFPNLRMCICPSEKKFVHLCNTAQVVQASSCHISAELTVCGVPCEYFSFMRGSCDDGKLVWLFLKHYFLVYLDLLLVNVEFVRG
jgi:hypothetical protein